MRFIVRFSVIGMLVCGGPWTSASAAAQSTAKDFIIRGVVVDLTRAAIVGARVEASSDSQSQPIVTISDQTGAFTLHVKQGQYRLRITATGLSPLEQDATATTAPAQPPTEFMMKVQGVQEDVTVAAAAGYRVPVIRSATKTATPLVDVPQSVTVVTSDLIQDQMMMSIGDVMRYVPGIAVHQGENNRDQVIIRGNSSSADFFVNGVRDDVQYYRDLYNLDRVEALKGPNALIFGRGGAGGVVNRVTKDANFSPLTEFSLQAGMFDNKRATMDVDRRVNDKVAVRLNAMFEDSDSFRDSVGLQRYGATPTITIRPSDKTQFIVRYEYLNDTRVADRGITSYQGRPADVDIATYYGDPNQSHVNANVNIGSASVEHTFSAFTLRNNTVVANYDRSYQNFVPGAVTADKSQVTLTAYNNATDRTNVFNQTDLTGHTATGRVRHTLLAGAEFGHQLTDNFRNTGFFNNLTTSVLVPYGNPTISTPVTFRQNATDADNHIVTNVMAAYAQDQLELSSHVQAVAGVRFDHFDQNYHDNRSGTTLQRPDNLVSPRLGLIYKPIQPVSVYGSYSISYLPGSGDQFSSLTNITQQLEPERFNNYELGAKWDARSGLSFTTAVYRLDRTNTRSIDPNNPTAIIQTGSQRTNGYEIGLNGRLAPKWTVAGGYAYQNAFVSSATATAALNAQVAQVPHNTLSLWNNYQFLPRLAAAVGVLYRSDMFAGIDNTVTLPHYTRADAAAFWTISPRLRLQANVENVFNATYYINADSNTNISPGFPRAFRVGLNTTF